MTAHTAATPDAESGSTLISPQRRNFVFLAIMLGMLMAALDQTIVATALPTIVADLGDAGHQSWVVTSYLLASTIITALAGRLGDLFGRKRVFQAAVAFFVVGSALCGISQSMAMLVGARALQGLGASGIMAVNSALIRFIFPSRILGRGFGKNAMVVATAMTLGPTIASGILSIGSWPWLFAVNIPFGLIAIGIGLKTLPHPPRAPHTFDFPGAILAASGLGLFIIGIGSAAHKTSPTLVGIELTAAIVLGALLIRRQADHPAPMLPIDLFRRPLFALSAATSVCSFAVQGLAFVSLPFYFEDILLRTQVETGFFMTPWPLVVAIMAPIGGRLSDRYPAGILGSIGLALLCVGMGLLATLPASPSVANIVWRMALCGFGFGFFQTPNLRTLMSSAPPNRSGSASGIVATARLTGQTTGAALAALCFALAGREGATLALALGAGFAAFGSVMSVLRLAVAPQRPA